MATFENWYESVTRLCGKLLLPPIWKRPVIGAVEVFGSFSGKSRSRWTHEKRNSFTTVGPNTCAWDSARFWSFRSWLPQKVGPNTQLLIAFSSTRLFR